MPAPAAPPSPSGLLPLQRRWVFPGPEDSSAIARLSRELRLPEPLSRLLVGRGYAEPAAARDFLRPHSGHIHPPTLAGIADAVSRLRLAIARRETILVHGDYDVDGICATALYVRALRAMGAHAEPFVPHRLKDGYDLTEAGVAAAAAARASLILTGDCGIVAHAAVALAARAGIDVIVTDHHTPGPTLPPAVAVVNPNRPDCGYPNTGLAGAGVAYKVCCALARELGYPEERLTGFLDLVAIATIADIAPLTGENRALVRWGLKVLAATPNPGLRALLRTTGLAGKGEMTSGQIGYILAPRINAVGRMGEALRGVRLLLTDDPREADGIARELETENRHRQSTDVQTLREAMAILEQSFDSARDRGVVLAADGWHPGVIGIVASRIVERIHRPTVMVALGPDGEGKGSARSVPGFHLYDAMRACGEHLVRFGGHRAAAGCVVRAERIEAFREAFDAQARGQLDDEKLVPQLRIDLEVELHEANPELLRLMRHVAPFGQGNATPVLCVRKVRVAGSPRLVGQDHLKFTAASDGAQLNVIAWGLGSRLAEVGRPDAELDLAFKLEEDSWRPRGARNPDPPGSRVQARLLDMRPSNRCA